MYLTGQEELQRVGSGGRCSACLFLGLAASWPQFDLPPLKGDIRYLAPSPALTPPSISLITHYYGVLSFHRSWSCVAGRPLGPIQNIIPLLSRIPFALKKDPGSLKSGWGPRAIQGVSNASRSARLLNAKQTVEQIKIKGSSLARLACCPHMPGAAVTVNHGRAASVLTLTHPLPLPHHLRATDLLDTVTAPARQCLASTLTNGVKTRQRIGAVFVRSGWTWPWGFGRRGRLSPSCTSGFYLPWEQQAKKRWAVGKHHGDLLSPPAAPSFALFLLTLSVCVVPQHGCLYNDLKCTGNF